MKIVALLIAGLLIASGVYLSLAQLNTPTAGVSVEHTNAEDGTMCTSTACIKNDMVAVSDNVKQISKIEQPAELADTIVEKQDAQAGITEAKKYIEFVNPSGFVNSEPFTLADYIGKKIIVLEFITYSCINCQRTFPYMKSWHEKYEKDGLLVIGIHTPEFSYERDRDNVVTAMKKEGITFPIAMDNDYQTWNAYTNRFWPHRYVIDYSGNIVFDHIGEGAYTQTEEVIQKLLAGN